MKKDLFVITAFLLLQFPLFGQTFREIPTTGARWKMERMEAEPPNPQCQQFLGYFLHSDGDTTIAGVTGTILRPGASAICYNTGFGCNPQPLGGIVHQDSAGRLFLLESNGSLWPLMDFSLNSGDTMSTFHPTLGSFSYLVNSVDTVTYADGIPRRRLQVNCQFCFINSSDETYWVEGIGDLYHGPIPLIEFENSLSMLCYNENSLFLTDGWVQNMVCSSDCDLLIANSEPIANDWKVWPNPGNGEWMLSIESSALAGEASAFLYGLDGQLLWQKNLDGANEFQISMLHLPAGNYLLRLASPSVEFGHSILMKE